MYLNNYKPGGTHKLRPSYRIQKKVQKKKPEKNSVFFSTFVHFSSWPQETRYWNSILQWSFTHFLWWRKYWKKQRNFFFLFFSCIFRWTMHYLTKKWFFSKCWNWNPHYCDVNLTCLIVKVEVTRFLWEFFFRIVS